jgi:hypothetical protein
MARTGHTTPERAGPCDCIHAYRVPRSPGLATVGHARAAAVATLQDVETPAGVVPSAPSAGRRNTCGRRSLTTRP